jgi:uncharacterized protein YdaU (DUF1376 family)
LKRHIPYFSLYPADFMNGVRGMSAQQVGVYMMLLCRIYEENGPVEYHLRRLATYCGMREATFEKVVSDLVDLGKLTLTDGMLSNRRAEAEISKRSHDLENNVRAGKASAEKRQQKQQQNATPVQQTFNHSDTDTDTVKDIALSREKVTPKRFSEFWEAYPHRGGVKRGRKPSQAKYERIIRLGISEQALIDGAKRYATDRRVLDGFAKDPVTWLNQDGWADEVDPVGLPKQAEPERAAKLARYAKIAGAA